jgi:hypothetical protein
MPFHLILNLPKPPQPAARSESDNPQAAPLANKTNFNQEENDGIQPSRDPDMLLKAFGLPQDSLNSTLPFTDDDLFLGERILLSGQSVINEDGEEQVGV